MAGREYIRQGIHIFKRDLRFLWPELILLYATLALQTNDAFRDPFERVEIKRSLTMALMLMLAVMVVTGRLVQQDTLLGTRAFWMTRPIHRVSLLMSKVLALACFLTAAFLSATGVLLTFGLSSEEFFRAVPDILFPYASLLTVSVLLAAVTPNLPVYLMAWVVLLISLQLTQNLDDLVAGSPKVADFTQYAVWYGAILLLGACLVVHQYWTPRTKRTLAGVVIAFFVVLLLPNLWPWDLGGRRRHPTVSGVQIGLHGTAPDGSFLAERESGGVMVIRAAPELLQSIAGRDLDVWVLESEWRAGPSTRTRLSADGIRIDAEGILAALQGFRWASGQRPSAPPLYLKTRGSVAFDDLVARSGSLRAKISGVAYSYRFAGTIPLQTGARLNRGWVTALVRHISRTDSQLRLVLHCRRVQVGQAVLGELQFPRAVLVNTIRKEVLVGTSRVEPLNLDIFGFASGYRSAGQEEAIVFPAEGEDGLVLDDAWLAQAELAFLQPQPEGWFQWQVHIPNFRMRGTTFDPQARSALVE
jgi:hypothetical protein